ncbi:MAG: extracellular solute-binding protein [Solirubrobacteraceae bacterium]
MSRYAATHALAFALATLALAAPGCGGGSEDAEKAAGAKGPIKIWYSNNQDEVAWGKNVVAKWNAAHPKEKVTGQEIPAGKTSEEVIGASITAGNAPCLIFNTAPAAVPQFQKQGGLVALDTLPGGAAYVEARSGELAAQYKSEDGKYYQLPWKSNPVMIFYNRKLLEKAGVDAKNPPLGTYDEFLATSRKIVSSKAADAAIWPSPESQFFQSWFDFYPLFIAESDGKATLEDGKAQFGGPEGQAVAGFWQKMYAERLAPNESFKGDAFGEQKAAMAIVGPWAIAVYGKDIDWGVAPVPTSAGKPAEHIKTFSDEKSTAMYSACKNRGTAWEFLKFATSKEQDGALLSATGQMPMRPDLVAAFPDYFAKNPNYKPFAEQAARTVEVPNVSNSIAIWQTLRDAYTRSVIFGKEDPKAALTGAAAKAEDLAAKR